MIYNYQDRKSEGKNQRVKPGCHSFRVVKAEEKLSKRGSEMIVLTLEILSDGGKTILDYLTFDEKSFWKVDAFLRCVQMAPSEVGNIEFQPQDMVNRSGQVEIADEQREWNGKTYVNSKVVAYYSDRETKAKAPRAKPVPAPRPYTPSVTPVPPKPEPRQVQAIKESTADLCFNDWVKAGNDPSDSAKWWDFVSGVVGQKGLSGDLTPAEWGKVSEAIFNANIPF